ncbi:protein PTST homolog 2, chloroplastic-like isoform X2 [Salvia splendens]|uniref:protein PTST homolog 2, chloroplastic-like isoform X2 n=1 Tax=Salvia splendens TaxID=180675 RepID=UPI001C26D472|nr:protein PTST homolog 2, chloroplastic-like isoform X2 [Salvia splendens]
MLSLTAHARIPTSNHRVSSFKARLLPALLSARKSTKPDNNCHKSLNLSFRLKEKRRALKLDSCGSHQGDGDEELEAEMMNFMAQSEKTTDSDIAEFQRRIESCKQSGSSSFLRATPQNLDSPHLAGSSSLETSQHHAADEDSGIDGMLSRLEKQRNSDLSGIKLRKNGYKAQTRSKDEGNDRHSDTSLGFGGTNLEENTRKMHAYHPKGTLDSSGDNIRHYTEPETWRSWMDRRAGFPLTEFEEDLDEHKEINYNEVRTRLWGLESELTTALRSIRSRREDNISKEVIGSSTELQSLSDAVEFQENEVMSAKQRLRSLRAKLAVLEGKITLATTEAQKIVEVKQKRIGDARKSLQLLRTTSIEWPNSAAQVLLAGSFDGWKTQRRMRRSKLGVFSITLMLYPGSYEIKFIADGNWKLDPLRPTINSNGYINNLFIVS